MTDVTMNDVHRYWFGEVLPTSEAELMPVMGRHTPASDDLIRERFGDTIAAARRGELDAWAESPRGLVALIIVLDQFPRHAFRGTAEQYDSDPKALALALRAYDRGWDAELSFVERIALGMVLTHSEDIEMQRRCVEESDRTSAEAPAAMGFFAEIGPAQSRKYLDVIERFGRFPHRNVMLGRTSTPEELEFLETWPQRQPPDILREKGLIP